MLDYIHLMISYWLPSRPLQAAGDILLEELSWQDEDDGDLTVHAD